MKRIGCFGEAGTFSHEAAVLAIKEPCELIFCQTLKKLVEDVSNGHLDRAVLPVENLVIGAVGAGLDSIIHANGSIKITGELLLPVRHNLIVARDCELELKDIKVVASIKEAVEQCGSWLEKNLGEYRTVHTNSTAIAVRTVGQHESWTAAIGSAFAAKLYGKKILYPNIQDSEENATHFLILSHSGDGEITGNDKTTIWFSTLNKPGALLDVLVVFKALDINMLKIESRPSKRKMHEYFFWVDLDGHIKEDKVKVALEAIKKKTEFLKILGSYPKYE